MNTRYPHLFARSLVTLRLHAGAWIVLCSAGIVACASSPLPQPVLPPIHDYQVIPGVRIGPVSIGMTESQLVDTMGPPYQDHKTKYGYQYRWDSLDATVHDNDRLVHRILVRNAPFRLSNGIRDGSTALEARARLPDPDVVERYPGSIPWESWCYNTGLELWISQSEIGSIWVIPPNDC